MHAYVLLSLVLLSLPYRLSKTFLRIGPKQLECSYFPIAVLCNLHPAAGELSGLPVGDSLCVSFDPA